MERVCAVDSTWTSLADQRVAIAAACLANDVRRLELFGSRARGDSITTSDADFLVEFNNPLRAGVFDRFLALRDALQSILGCRIDLVERSAVENPILRRRIDQDRTLVYAA
jgi:predicted nucleotidyltransferase